MDNPNGLTTLDVVLELKDAINALDAKVDALCVWQAGVDTQISTVYSMVRWFAGMGALVIAGIALRVFGG